MTVFAQVAGIALTFTTDAFSIASAFQFAIISIVARIANALTSITANTVTIAVSH